MSRILLLEAAGPESGALAATATRHGHEVFAATHPSVYATYPPSLRALLAGCLDINVSTPEAAVKAITAFAHRRRIEAILTASEYLTPLAAQACSAAGLPGNDPHTAHAARNKLAMSHCFATHRVAAPTTALATSEADVATLTRGPIPMPCVIKPAEHAGSTGVTIAHDTAEAVGGYQRARHLDHQPHHGISLNRQVLIQQRLEGAEYSVESLTHHAHTHHICITRKQVNAQGVEVGHALPSSLPPDIHRRILTEVDRAIAAVGIRNTASHTEVIVAPNGQCSVIEIGARPGAGRIGFLIEHALGLDWWRACLDTALGRPAELCPTRAGYAAIRFLTSPRSGYLHRLENLPTPGPGVPMMHTRTAIGDRVEPPRSNSARLGCFIVTGTDPTTVEHNADHLLSAVAVHVVPDHHARPPGGGAP